jgi:hypothetical protein
MHFPQQFAEEFWYLKGVLALLATVAYITHMSRTWPQVTSRAQQLRYLSLLYFAVLITAVSVNQVTRGAVVTWQSVAAFIGAALLLGTAWVSLRERDR